jgi:hypothetical protein
MKFGEDARTMDFLDDVPGDYIEYKPLTTALTPEQIKASAVKRAEFDRAVRAEAVKTAAVQTSNVNTAYRVTRKESDVDALRLSNESAAYIVKYMSGPDWGLLPAAANIIATVVVIASTGGFAAPAIAASWKTLKSQIKDIDSLKEGISAVQKGIQQGEEYTAEVKGKVEAVIPDVGTNAFTIPDLGMNTEAIGAAYAIADQILGSPTLTNSPAVIRATQALAFTGNIDAQRGAVVLADVAAQRAKNRVPFGQPALPVKSPEQAAWIAHVLPLTIHPVTATEHASIAAIAKHHWWERLLAFFHLERKLT